MILLEPGNSEHFQLKLGYGDYLRFRDLVLEQSGLYFPEKKWHDLEAGLARVMAGASVPLHHGTYDLNYYYNLVSSRDNPDGQAEMKRLINALTIDETHFFRDDAQMNALTNHVLPALLATKRASAAALGPTAQPQLRIWSAGCSTGEEPYSIAMLLKQLLPDIAAWNILILATDINSNSLNRAEKGVYSDWSFREERAKKMRQRYFTQHEDDPRTQRSARYELQGDIRSMVSFAPLNLITDTYPAIVNNTVSLDLILCRNVTIYFTEENTRRLIKQFYQALVNGGWLVVGHSEPSLLIYDAFQVRVFPDAILYQKEEPTMSWFTERPSKIALETRPQLVGAVLLEGAVDRPLLPKAELQIRPPLEIPATSAADDPYDVAATLLRQGDVSAAITALRRKVEADPDFGPAYSRLGQIYANQGDWDNARQWCRHALEIDNLSAQAYYVLGLIYEHEDNVPLAIDMLKKAVYLERNAPLPYVHLAMLNKKTGARLEAQRACQNAINILKKWPPETIVANADEATAGYLLDIVQKIQHQLET